METQLINPPIVEAVLDIDCDMPNSINFLAMDHSTREGQVAAVKEAFGQDYPDVREILGIQHSFEVHPDGAMPGSTFQNIAAIQAISDDGKQLIQVRPQGFSFNRLAPYTSFDEYLPAVKKAWFSFIELANPIQTRSLKMRFINVLKIPTKNGGVELDEYLKLGPRLPDDENMKITNFLNHISAVENGTGHKINTVMSITPRSPEDITIYDHVPILFDNGAECDIAVDPKDWRTIDKKISELRQLKNRTFNNTLTKSCLALFQ